MKKYLTVTLFALIFLAAVLFFFEKGPEKLSPDKPESSGLANAGAGIAEIPVSSEQYYTTEPSVNITPNGQAGLENAAVESATVIFTFDDGNVSDYTLAFPMLKKYGIRGTSYIVPSFQDSNIQSALSWDMIKEMTEYGWVFGCHTYDHSDLTKMSMKEITENMENVNEAFQKQSMPIPILHAFPYGKYSPTVIDTLKTYRLLMRKAYNELKFVSFDNPYGVDSCSADMMTVKKLDMLERFIDKACEEKAVVVFRCHCLCPEYIENIGDWGTATDSRLFEKLIEYCVNKGCRFSTMAQLSQMFDYNAEVKH